MVLQTIRKLSLLKKLFVEINFNYVILLLFIDGKLTDIKL